MNRSDPPARGGARAVVSGPAQSTRLRVRHRTTFEYGAEVRDSVNVLHLVPRQFPFQRTVSALVRVLPATRLRRFADLFDNVTHHFEIAHPHRRLEIESRVSVENLPLTLSEREREAGCQVYQDTAVRERVWPYLQESPFVSRPPELWRAAVDATTGVGPVYQQALGVMRWIHSEFTYRPGATRVTTRVEEAFGLREGVCQDFTHVMIAMCRSVGIPARYASGYLYNGPADRLVGAQASHAWCEIHLPDSGWIGFDPTNNTLADARYVKAAVGRDYHDVAPVKGTYHGTARCEMTVEVLVELEGG